MTETILIKTLLSGNYSVDAQTNTQILNATIEYVLTTKRFNESVLFLTRKSFWLFFISKYINYIITQQIHEQNKN